MGRVRVTWWGHSTVAIEDRGVRLLTDPVLRGRLAHLRRRRGDTPDLDTVAPDAVLVSHLHADHLDVVSLRRLDPGTRLLVPRGARAFLRQADSGLARRCEEIGPGEETKVGDVLIRAVPANHHAGRGPWSRHRAPALGYTVHGERTAWFAGDTDLFDGMSDLGPLDLALVPVGGWGPTLGRGHLHPGTAAEAVRRAAPGWAIPIHFGTFWPIGLERVRPHRFFGPGEEFAGLLPGAAPRTRVRVLQPGESFSIDGTEPPG
jgi:L-ascorbate metabolism protein UlaG (beta-lactamase superfamily)